MREVKIFFATIAFCVAATAALLATFPQPLTMTADEANYKIVGCHMRGARAHAVTYQGIVLNIVCLPRHKTQG
jgi:hypothetical protein